VRQLLQDKVYISTRPLNQSAELEELLQTAGAQLLKMPTIEIQPAHWTSEMNAVIAQIGNYDWILFTSANGVKYFFLQLQQLTKSFELPQTLKIATVGKQTAIELEEYGQKAHFISPGNSSEDLANSLLQVMQAEDKVLLSVGSLARETLELKLREHVTCSRLDVYHTVIPKYFDEKIIEKIGTDQYDQIIVTSPSAFVNLLTVLEGKVDFGRLRFTSIGKTTTSEIIKHHLTPTIQALMASSEGIFKAIVESTIL
jgi:uroporphyrinogen-III synthase